MKFENIGRDCFPVDTDDSFWIANDVQLTELIERVQEKWPGVSLADVNIEPVKHHQYSVTYDLYDSSDYVDYLFVRKVR